MTTVVDSPKKSSVVLIESSSSDPVLDVALMEENDKQISQNSKDLLDEILSDHNNEIIPTPKIHTDTDDIITHTDDDRNNNKGNNNDLAAAVDDTSNHLLDDKERRQNILQCFHGSSVSIIDDDDDDESNHSDTLKKVEEEIIPTDETNNTEEITNDDPRVQRYVKEELRKQQLIHETEMEQVTERHSEEIDDIFDQLNQVEEDFSNQLKSMEARLSKKNVMIDALGDQLSDLQDQNLKLKSDLTESKEENAQQLESLTIANGAVDELKESMEHMEHKFNQILADKRQQYLIEVQQVQSDIATEAERQFSEANECYVSLKQDYDELCMERQENILHLENLQTQSENDFRKWKSEEASMLAEIAKLKAELATSSADAAALRKEFTIEMEAMIDREKKMQMQLNNTKIQNKSAQKSLTTMMKENEKLQRENVELQSVCEELMSIVEGKQ